MRDLVPKNAGLYWFRIKKETFSILSAAGKAGTKFAGRGLESIP